MSIQISIKQHHHLGVVNMSSVKVIALVLLVVAVVVSEAYPRLVVIDDAEIEDPYDEVVEASEQVRIIRDDKKASPSALEPARSNNRGRVGPVYSFVRTDPKANFKWGVRHRVGSQYGR